MHKSLSGIANLTESNFKNERKVKISIFSVDFMVSVHIKGNTQICLFLVFSLKYKDILKLTYWACKGTI